MDILLYETLDGGNISIQNNDIALTDSIWNQIYIGLFGGNYQQNTDDNVLDDEQRFDWWANTFISDIDEQLNSETERILNTVALNSAGRLTIEQAVKNDLSFLSKLGDVTVEVSLPKLNTVQIDISIQEPEEITDKKFRIIWDATRQSNIIELGDVLPGGVVVSAWILRNGIWDDLGIWDDNAKWQDD